MLMLRSCFAVAILCYFGDVIFAQHNVEFHFSQVAEKMPEYLGRREYRQDRVVPHLFQADIIHVSICINESTTVQIHDIHYSNDGKNDTVLVQIDGSHIIGEFTTHGNSDWGNLWAKRSKSGYIGETGMLSPGKHELTFLVVSSEDCFGLELWSLNITVFIAVDPATFWCDSNYILAEKKKDCGGTRVSEDLRITPGVTIPTTTTPTPSYVKVTQLSKTTNCFDKENVKIVFSTGQLAGTNITTRQEMMKTQAPQFSVDRRVIEGRLCDKEIWQLGKMDESNNEFSPIFPGKRHTVNLTDEAFQEQKFPMKLLPFTTSEIVINFDMPPHVNMKEGSAYFALGLINLTKLVEVGLSYYDDTIGGFSRTHYVRFSPKYQVFGWNIPNLGKTDNVKNTFHLVFDSDANVVMFDFLKLLYTKRDERKQKSLIAKRGNWKINGLRYETSVGMTVNTDHAKPSQNIEDVIIMYQQGDLSRYKTVLRINAEGMFYPYKTYYIQQEETENAMVDISGFYLNQRLSSSFITKPIKIQTLFIDTKNDIVKATFDDGSILHLHMIITSDETTLQIIKYEQLENNNNRSYAQNLIFASTYVNDFHAAVNTIRNDDQELNILTPDLDILSGGYNYTLRKTSTSNLFYANNIFNINFPKY